MSFLKNICAVLVAAATATAVVINPVIDTDKSVNTYSIATILADVIKPGMTNQEKLDALFSVHRRMMHHFRLEQGTEDNVSDFDIIKVYNVYGGAWCTQQAVIFRALLEPVFGYSNVRAAGSEGPLRTSGALGGHSSFEVRFNSADSWHWVDPIIGAYAFNKTNGAIASLLEIKNDHSILTDAVKDGRASNPYFSCTAGVKSTSDSIAEAYSYYDYDINFMNGFADRYNQQDVTWARQSALFTMKKNIMKGESYHWLWDFLEIDYHNIQDRTYAHINSKLTRDWRWYPPRHLCGDKDSADIKNWPYFKPYAKFIKDRVSYRYFANGIHKFEPDLKSRDAFDGATHQNAAFYYNDLRTPEIRPATNDSISTVIYRFKLPYPLMNLTLRGTYTRTNPSDSLAIIVSQVRLNRKLIYTYNYLDTLSNEPDSVVAVLPIALNGSFDIPLRNFVDPQYRNMFETYYGYRVKLVMKSTNSTENTGFHSLKTEAVFQHNMFALPQLEPGKNLVSVAATTSDSILRSNKLEVSFSWLDSGVTRSSIHRVATSRDTHEITVNQIDMPKMLSMTLSNKSDTAYDNISAEKSMISIPTGEITLSASPNPFNASVKIALNGTSHLANAKIAIYTLDGRQLFQKNFAKQNSIVWNADRIPSGIYVVKLLQGSDRKVSRLIMLSK